MKQKTKKMSVVRLVPFLFGVNFYDILFERTSINVKSARNKFSWQFLCDCVNVQCSSAETHTSIRRQQMRSYSHNGRNHFTAISAWFFFLCFSLTLLSRQRKKEKIHASDNRLLHASLIRLFGSHAVVCFVPITSIQMYQFRWWDYIV